MKTLVTFSGRYGDILWSLATVHQIGLVNGKVDMGVMPAYRSLLPLLTKQPYINKAFAIDNWITTGSPFGDQPWQAPQSASEGYERTVHLTYRFHPQEYLIDAIMRNGLACWKKDPEPFVFIDPDDWDASNVDIAVGFNGHYENEKRIFIERLCSALELNLGRTPTVARLEGMPWTSAAAQIVRAKMFVGCRSSLAVLAHGVGQRCLIYEPAPERRPRTFSSPYGMDIMPETWDLSAFAAAAMGWLK